MIELNIDDLDLDRIADSGQCFRWHKADDKEYIIPHRDRLLHISQKGDRFKADCTQSEWDEVWSRYFDMDTDYAAIGRKIMASDNEYLRASYEAGKGIRILRQDLWEIMVSFMISQNNNIKRIKTSISNICLKNNRLLGDIRMSGTDSARTDAGGQIDGSEAVFCAFPEPDELGAGFFDDTTLGLGYRNEYLKALYEWGRNHADELRGLSELSYEESYKRLTAMYGIGAKVANCICLFGLHHIDAFPIDTHVKQILDAHFPEGFPFEDFQGVSGIVQQYMFYYKQFLGR
ncbi:MAG: 8-oxoguanine DNA glycosylase [Lachnospiraceae bacterium]|nr:8-oxoguanine DNA glycosylase [Lachnospiraceae bacterium]